MSKKVFLKFTGIYLFIFQLLFIVDYVFFHILGKGLIIDGFYISYTWISSIPIFISVLETEGGIIELVINQASYKM